MALTFFLNPSSVALVSEDEKSIHMIKNRLEKEFKGDLYLVMKDGAYTSIRQIQKAIDLAIIMVRGKKLLRSLDDCHKKRVKNIILLGNLGIREAELERIIEKKKLKVLHGEVYVPKKIDLLTEDIDRPLSGGLAIVSNSELSKMILDLMGGEGLGVFAYLRFSEVGLGLREIVKYLAKVPEIKLIVINVDQEMSAKDLKMLEKVNKNIILFTNPFIGKKISGNILWTDDVDELLDYSKALLMAPRPRGKDIFIITNAETEFGLELKQPSRRLVAKLKKLVGGVTGNPLILKEGTTEVYRSVITMVEKEYDAVFLVLSFQMGLDESLVYALAVLKKLGKPLIVCTFGGSRTAEIRKRLESFSVPTFTSIKRALRAYEILIKYKR